MKIVKETAMSLKARAEDAERSSANFERVWKLTCAQLEAAEQRVRELEAEVASKNKWLPGLIAEGKAVEQKRAEDAEAALEVQKQGEENLRGLYRDALRQADEARKQVEDAKREENAWHAAAMDAIRDGDEARAALNDERVGAELLRDERDATRTALQAREVECDAYEHRAESLKNEYDGALILLDEALKQVEQWKRNCDGAEQRSTANAIDLSEARAQVAALQHNSDLYVRRCHELLAKWDCAREALDRAREWFAEQRSWNEPGDSAVTDAIFAALSPPAAPCPHPARQGRHEFYLRDGTQTCRACGALAAPPAPKPTPHARPAGAPMVGGLSVSKTLFIADPEAAKRALDLAAKIRAERDEPAPKRCTCGNYPIGGCAVHDEPALKEENPPKPGLFEAMKQMPSSILVSPTPFDLEKSIEQLAAEEDARARKGWLSPEARERVREVLSSSVMKGWKERDEALNEALALLDGTD